MAICALCREEAELQNSHLLPKAVYKVITGRNVAKKSQPILVDGTTGSAVQTNEQITQYLLCACCENRFNSSGETILGRLWATEGSFPLLSKLNALGMDVWNGYQKYDTRGLPKEASEALYYFAVSIVWRAYVWDWDRTKSEAKKVPLGKRYSELFRQYLLGERHPTNTYLYAFIDTGENPVRKASLPIPVKCKGYTQYFFDMPGITFCLMVGGQIHADILSQLSLMQSRLLIVGHDYRASDIYKRLTEMIRENIEVKGKLAKRPK